MDFIEFILAQNVTFAKSSIPKDLLEYFEPAECGACYVCRMVEVFRAVRRVLHPSGTLWCNLGDSYNGAAYSETSGWQSKNGAKPREELPHNNPGRSHHVNIPGLKRKDLIGIPWRVAFALQADGWYLRSDIIWHKPNPMPESVTDRPTKAHEYIFLLSKSDRYFYDADAIREPHARTSWSADGDEAGRTLKGKHVSPPKGSEHRNRQDAGTMQGDSYHPLGRNRRSVWTVTTKPYKMAHFATFPPDLIEPCILAGTSAHGACAQCGAPWERVVERESNFPTNQREGHPTRYGNTDTKSAKGFRMPSIQTTSITRGWQPTCLCGCTDVTPCTVLDPFAGSGTTLAVALKHGRRGIGIELNESYIELAHRRITQSQPMLLAV